jgi:hypothetical protein
MQWVSSESEWVSSPGTEWEDAETFVFPVRQDIQTVYRFTLTGDRDGMSDVIIPVSSCQMRRRDGEPSYMSVVVPDYGYLDEISARPNGAMKLDRGVLYSDGELQLKEIAVVDLEDIRPDWGGKSRSITLSGHRTVSTPDPSVVTLTGASYRTVNADGKRRYRCNVDLFLRPGDTADINGESITVGFISYFIGRAQETMEIEEK